MVAKYRDSLLSRARAAGPGLDFHTVFAECRQAMATLRSQENTGFLPAAAQKNGLRSAYNDTYLRILMRTPGELFAFWECSPESVRAAVETAGRDGRGFRPILRLFDAGSQPDDCGQAVADYPLEKGEDSRYIPVPQQGRPYRLECGIATRSGRFIALCASNEIRAPLAASHPATIETAGDRQAMSGAEPHPGFEPDRQTAPCAGHVPAVPAPFRSREEVTRLMGGGTPGGHVPSSGDGASRHRSPVC
jgi:hypothetical protein